MVWNRMLDVRGIRGRGDVAALYRDEGAGFEVEEGIGSPVALSPR